MQDDADVESGEALAGGKRGFTSTSLMRGCSTTSREKRTRSFSSAAKSTGGPQYSFEGLVDASSFHHPARQRGVERREGQGPVLVDLDELAAGAEEQDGPELRVNTAANDKLVVIRGHDRLHRYPVEMFCTHLFTHGRFYLVVRLPGDVRVYQRFSWTPPTSVLWVIDSE